MTICEFYEKAIKGQWYDSRINRTVEVFVITYEMTQKPSREKILIMEILKDFPDAGSFEYHDEEKAAYEKGMPVYPGIQLGSINRKEITRPSL